MSKFLLIIIHVRNWRKEREGLWTKFEGDFVLRSACHRNRDLLLGPTSTRSRCAVMSSLLLSIHESPSDMKETFPQFSCFSCRTRHIESVLIFSQTWAMNSVYSLSLCPLSCPPPFLPVMKKKKQQKQTEVNNCWQKRKKRKLSSISWDLLECIVGIPLLMAFCSERTIRLCRRETRSLARKDQLASFPFFNNPDALQQ